MAAYLNNGDNPWDKYGITFYDFKGSQNDFLIWFTSGK